MRKYLTVLVLALLAAPLFADIELSTSIQDVFNRGSNEQAGSITMNVNEDDFAEASTEEPIFIRVTVDHQARLAQTLVNLAGTDTAVDDPIYLAMRLNSTNASLTCVADVETTSIVRWVAGESAFWIRVQSSSSTWIDLDPPDDAFPPREGLTVSWTVGISARTSRNENKTRANMLFNTRLAGSADEADSTSTLLCVNLSGSTLTTDGFESILQYDPIAFDHNAEIGLGQYSQQSGNIQGINFTNDFRIARGKDRSCSVQLVGKTATPDTSLCVSQAGTNGTVSGFILACNSINFQVDCQRGGLFLDTDLLDGAFVTLSTGGRGNYGFDDLSDDDGFASEAVAWYSSYTDGDPVLLGIYEVDTATRFTSHDRDLYRNVKLAWNSDSRDLDRYAFTVNACVAYYYSEGPVKVDLDWSLTLVNHEGSEDIDDSDELNGGDFDGDDQFKRCAPSQFNIGSGVWDFGNFIECAGNPVSIFFPYVPKLKDGDFWAGLSVVNQGAADFAEGGVEVHTYLENGDSFSTTLPALPIRHQYTWLMVDDAQGTGFYGMGDFADTFAAPAGTSTENTLEFGVTRSSMFVVGNFVAAWSEQINSGDLDGYMLIGHGTDIDGSYLPRNYDNDVTNQDASLPIQRSKREAGSRVISNKLGQEEPVSFRFRNGKYQDNK
jgi:hypothetical protein